MIWTGEGDYSVRSCCQPLLEKSPMVLYGNSWKLMTDYNYGHFTHARNLYITGENVKS